MRRIPVWMAVTLALASVVAAGCKEKKQAPKQAEASGGGNGGSTPPGNAQDAAVPSVNDDSADATTAGTVGDGLGLFERLEAEKQARPTGGPNADSIIGALDSSGVKLKSRKQYLGSTVKAIYCEGGQTEAGLAVAVCEYSDAEAAKRGKEYVENEFVIDGRVIWVKGRTTMAVSRGTRTPDNNRELSHAKESFLGKK